MSGLFQGEVAMGGGAPEEGVRTLAYSCMLKRSGDLPGWLAGLAGVARYPGSVSRYDPCQP